MSKIQTYPLLESPPYADEDKYFLDKIGLVTNANDYIDVVLLYSVYRDAVDFLISEDKGLHNRALKVSLKDRVLSSEEALGIFAKGFPKEKVGRPPALKEEYVYNLNINDPFFDPLRKEYPEFDKWLRKIQREGRKCWVYFENRSIGALLIYKVENEPINSSPPLPLAKRLKLCTFRVVHKGYKIGELFIKLSVEYCVKNGIDEMYLTHFTKKGEFGSVYLVDLLAQYGFSNIAKKDGEDVYLKRLVPDKTCSISPSEFSRIYYPSFYDGPRANKFIVPIRPEYHNRLFTDYRGRQTTIPEHAGEFIIEGNTISKAYLSHSATRKISKGDILLFYRSKDKKELTSIGVVEEVHFNLKDRDRVMKLVGKRTVYPIVEIEEILRQPTLVILFRWHFHFLKPLGLVDLKRMKIFENAPQTIVKISHNKYQQIKKEERLDERYTFN